MVLVGFALGEWAGWEGCGWVGGAAGVEVGVPHADQVLLLHFTPPQTRATPGGIVQYCNVVMMPHFHLSDASDYKIYQIPLILYD